MALTEIRPGLCRWTARHPEWTPKDGADGWGPDVASYLYESSETLVLFDPLVPGEDVWRELDERVAAYGPPHVLITLFWHVRSTPAIAARYPGTRVWAHAREPWIGETRKRVRVTDAFSLGEALPAGIEAREPREVVYWIPEQAALVAGDVLLGTPGGGLRVCPWVDEHTTEEELRANIRLLLELPIEVVLLTHGETVEDGRLALERAVHAPSAA